MRADTVPEEEIHGSKNAVVHYTPVSPPSPKSQSLNEHGATRRDATPTEATLPTAAPAASKIFEDGISSSASSVRWKLRSPLDFPTGRIQRLHPRSVLYNHTIYAKQADFPTFSSPDVSHGWRTHRRPGPNGIFFRQRRRGETCVCKADMYVWGVIALRLMCMEYRLSVQTETLTMLNPSNLPTLPMLCDPHSVPVVASRSARRREVRPH